MELSRKASKNLMVLLGSNSDHVDKKLVSLMSTATHSLASSTVT